MSLFLPFAPLPEKGAVERSDACYGTPRMPNPEDANVTRSTSRVWYYAAFVLIVVVAASVRLWDSASWRKTGFDELIYRRYLTLMDGGTQKVAIFQKDMSIKLWEYDVEGTGAGSVPSLTRLFLRTQAVPGTECELPPTRFLYIYTSWLWKNLRFGNSPDLGITGIAAEWQKPPTAEDRSNDVDRRDPPLRALHEVALGFGLLMVIAAGLFGIRMFGPAIGLGVMALVAFDPVLIHLSQHAMVDGFFAFWALLVLWTTWENLRHPDHRGWLIAHAVCLALMVMTKENAFFVYCALALVVVANRWLAFGKVTTRFIVSSIAGPAVGLVVLILLAGGVESFTAIYRTLVEKAQNLPYAQETGDGPWYRYLVDLMTVSPIVLCLALGALFRVAPQRKDLVFLAVFVAGSYLIMCNIRYGMNLRYASIWSFPLRAAAVLMIWQLCSRLGPRQWIASAAAVLALCVYDLRQYSIFATNPDRPLYELVPNDLLRLVKIIKS
jgi:hypothetical protein